MFSQFPKKAENRWQYLVNDSFIPLCFETMCFENGVLANINYHQQRYEYTLHNYFAKTLKLSNIILVDILFEFNNYLKINGLELNNGLFRVKFSYDQNNFKFEIFPYKRRSFKIFKPVIADTFDYSFKFYDRSNLDKLRSSQTDCDEIIIVKNNLLSDCSIGNLVLIKNNEFFTPKTPLLKGTMRALLIEQGVINPVDIKLSDLDEFTEIIMINALNPLKY